MRRLSFRQDAWKLVLGQGGATSGVVGEPGSPAIDHAPTVGTAKLDLALAPVRISLQEDVGITLIMDTGLHISTDRPLRCYGLGERTGTLEKTGRRYQNWNTDVGAYGAGDDPLYQSHPFVLGIVEGLAFGVFVDTSSRSTFDLREANQIRVATPDEGLTVYLISGPRIETVLERYTGLVGRAPMPPLWALGYHHSRWGLADADEAGKVARTHRELELPLDALWLDLDHMRDFRVFTFDETRFAQPAQLTAELEQQGLKLVVIVDPAVKREEGYRVYDEGIARNCFLRHQGGRVFEGRLWAGQCVWPDFSRSDVRTWWADLHRYYLDAGVSGFWNDMNEPPTKDAQDRTQDFPDDVLHQAGPHQALHNLYGNQMCQATREGCQRLDPERRPFVLTRAGFAGVQKHAMVWTGDNRSCWEHLAMSIPMILNMGLSGVPFCGADIGGFADDCDGELLTRWMELGCLYPFARNHSAHDTSRQEPWCFGDEVLQAARSALRLRYSLLPYLYTLAAHASLRGLPIWRPPFAEDQSDPLLATIDDQFFIGDALLAAPVVGPGQTSRRAYLPAGCWQDFWTGRWHRGPAQILAAALPGRVPIWQRAGTAVPLTAPDVQTHRAQWDPLVWRIAPGPHMMGRCYEDDGDGPVNGGTSVLLGETRGNTLHIEVRDRAATGDNRVEFLGAPISTVGGRAANSVVDSSAATVAANLAGNRCTISWASPWWPQGRSEAAGL